MRAEQHIEQEKKLTFAKERNLPDKVMLLNKDSTDIDNLTEIPDNSVDLMARQSALFQKRHSSVRRLGQARSPKAQEGGIWCSILANSN